MPTTPPVSNVPDNDPSTVEKVYSILEEKKDALDNEIFLYQGSEPSTVYRYDGFVAGLKVMTESGVAGKFYYLGDDSENGYKYGLVNLAAFIGQSMKETIQCTYLYLSIFVAFDLLSHQNMYFDLRR